MSTKKKNNQDQVIDSGLFGNMSLLLDDNVKNVDNDPDSNAENSPGNEELATNSGYNMITFSLPDNFEDILKNTIDSEFKVAQKKWGIRLTTNDKNVITENTYAQLVQKVNDTAYTDWKVDERVITIKILPEDENMEIKDVSVSENTFTPISMKDKVIVFNVTQGYTIVDTPTRKTILMSEFYEHFIETILNWTRTGIFYGVASFTE